MAKLIIVPLATLGFILGFLVLFTPVPMGVVIMAISLSALICVSDNARRLVKKVRSRSQKIHRQLLVLESKIDKKLLRLTEALQQTHPDAESIQ